MYNEIRMLEHFLGITCRSCEYCGKDCKRMDYKHLKPYRPHFKCDESAIQSHHICSDFRPGKAHADCYENWDKFGGFKTWWNAIITEYPSRKMQRVSFWLDDDTDTNYSMWLTDFVNGNMWREDGTLNYNEIWRYKQTKEGCGWRIVREVRK